MEHEEIKNSEPTSSTSKYRETRRRYYELNRDKILARCLEMTKNRYHNDPEYRQKTKERSKTQYIPKKNKELREQIQALHKEISEVEETYKETIKRLAEEHKNKITELNEKIKELKTK